MDKQVITTKLIHEFLPILLIALAIMWRVALSIINFTPDIAQIVEIFKLGWVYLEAR